MKHVFLKPSRADLIIPDPFRADILPAEGRQCEMSSYWARRLSDGTVVRVDNVKDEPKPTRATRATSFVKAED